MKIPYLDKKRKLEMQTLAGEFSTAICLNLQTDKVEQRLNNGWLIKLYPLLALLQLLMGEKLSVNPSREFALAGAKLSGQSNLFLEAMNSFHASDDVSSLMQKAYSSTIFTGFIAELRSDLLLVLMQSLIFSYRGTAINLRCALEDLYRHLYYMDHAQEYSALSENRETEYSMNLSPLKFREYLSKTNYLFQYKSVKTDFSPKTKNSSEMDLFGLNESLYASLSAAVHGASEHWFSALSSASSLIFNGEKEKILEQLCVDFCKMTVGFLIAAHKDIFNAASEYDKSIVLDIFSVNERRNLRHLLNI